MNPFVGFFVLAISTSFLLPATAPGQERPNDEPAPPPSREEVLDEIFRNRWCALRGKQATNIRELRELVTEDGVSSSPAEALRMSRNQTYLYLEVQKSIRSVLTEREELNAWAREQAQDPEIADYNADDEKAWDALTLVARKLTEIHPFGRALNKAASGAEKLNEKLIEVRLAEQYRAMVESGEVQRKELREFHDKITEQLRAERRRRARISELVREREELEQEFYPQLRRLFELRSQLQKYDLRREPDFEGDCDEEWRRLRECPACWKEDWEEKRYRHVDIGVEGPTSRPTDIGPAIRVVKKTLEYISPRKFRPVWWLVDESGTPVGRNVALRALQTRTFRDDHSNVWEKKVNLTIHPGGIATYEWYWNASRSWGEVATFRWTLLEDRYRFTTDSIDSEIALD